MDRVLGTRVLAQTVRRVASVLLRPEVIIGSFLLVAMLYKIKMMWPAARGSIFISVVQHDAPILGLILLLYVGGMALAQKAEKLNRGSWTATLFAKLCMMVCLIFVLLYLADVFVYYFFATRLYASDIVTFSQEIDSATSLLLSGGHVLLGRPLWKIAAITLAILLLFGACWRILLGPLRHRFPVGAPLSLGIPMLLLYSVPLPAYVYAFGDKPLYENFIERNASFFVNTSFSDGFRDKLRAAPVEVVCMRGNGRRINVILLIAEGLSAYQSGFFSGIEDWTPRLDEIARRETALTNFHANGFTTIGGLLSLLGGTFPFVPEKTQFNAYGSPRLTDFLDVPRPLPRVLHEQGYATAFVAGGDLSFLGQDQWLRTIGFQRLIGHNDPRYAKQEVRGPFKSVPDRLLFDVALEEVKGMPGDKPFFMVVQTFWSHPPFMDPNGKGLDNEESVVREADREIGFFYERLMQSGFFDNGLLFITGDHRTMQPFRKAEFDRFGASAVTRIPAVIVTRAATLPQVLDQNFQQRDFGASIRALVTDKVCLRPFEGVFLGKEARPASCVMHARGDERGFVFVKCGEKEGTVWVLGDATRVVSGAVEDETSVIETINVTRVRPISSAMKVARP